MTALLDTGFLLAVLDADDDLFFVVLPSGRINMTTAVQISDNLVKEAQFKSIISSRSIATQIEYWASIGQIVEENQDLPYAFIRDILLAKEQVKSNDLTEYSFG